MTSSKEWDEINLKMEEVTTLIKKSGLTMISATFGNEALNHWKYKVWIPKANQKRKK